MMTPISDSNPAAIPARSGEPVSPELARAAEAFEAVFLRLMLKSMRETLPKDGLLSSHQMATWNELQDAELSRSLASRRQLGIARLIIEQLGRSAPAAPSNTPDPAPDSDPKQTFVRELLPLARQAARRLGIPAMVLVAQAALETGWGRHVPRRADGRSSHNLFGIKANRDWSGESALNPTTEFVQGMARRVSAAFRSYPSAAASVADYTDLVQRSSRYAAARRAGSAKAYLNALQAGGYATDPLYAQKVLALLDDPVFKVAHGAPAR